MILVTTSYIVSAILVACVFAISLLLGLALSKKSRRTRLLFSGAGMLIIAIASLERVGWAQHPWSPGSPAQAWNDLCFRILFLCGFGSLFISWTVAFLQAAPRSVSEKSRERRLVEYPTTNF